MTQDEFLGWVKRHGTRFPIVARWLGGHGRAEKLRIYGDWFARMAGASRAAADRATDRMDQQSCLIPAGAEQHLEAVMEIAARDPAAAREAAGPWAPPADALEFPFRTRVCVRFVAGGPDFIGAIETDARRRDGSSGPARLFLWKRVRGGWAWADATAQVASCTIESLRSIGRAPASWGKHQVEEDPEGLVEALERAAIQAVEGAKA